MADWIARRISNLLPRRVVEWCVYRVLGVATAGDHEGTDPRTLTAYDALDRWDAAR